MDDRIEEKEYLYWLCQVPVLGAVTIARLLKQVGSCRELYYIEGNRLEKMGLLDSNGASCIEAHKKRLQGCRREYHSLAEKGISFVTPLDREYPGRLKYIHGYPMGLYVKGHLPREEAPTAAIIGARACSGYGRQMAEYMSGALSRAGVQIVSGLAAGIDGAGHTGALEAGADTYGVLGCGIDICYPRENRWLYGAMERRGGILSECRMGEPPQPKNFPMRNRIISGLADAILVIEARERSGSLITAELGLEQGKEIFALPGRVSDPLSAGCNRLIQDGAGILINPQDVMEALGISGKISQQIQENKNLVLAKKEKMLYSCLDSEPKNIEQIAVESGLSVSECMRILVELQMSGSIIETAGYYYALKLK